MQVLALRRICFAVTLVTMIVIGFAQSNLWGLIVFGAAGVYLTLVSIPLWFMRGTARVHGWIVALALGITGSMAVMWLTMPLALHDNPTCDFYPGMPTCKVTVSIVKVFTGQPTDSPVWQKISDVALVAAILLSLALWVMVWRHVRRSHGEDLREGGMHLALPNETSIVAPLGSSITRPSTQFRFRRPAGRDDGGT